MSSSNVQHDPAGEDKAELTGPLQSTATAPATNFDFPTLAIDGSPSTYSAPSFSSHTTTPPAALSSAGAKLAMSLNTSSSTTSLSDSHYDMVDDASDISNDDRDTASLPSTEHNESDEGAMTPDGSVVDVEEEHAQDIDDSDDFTVQEDSFQKLPGPQQVLGEDTKEENSLLDSYMNDELETPRQSMLTHGTSYPLAASMAPMSAQISHDSPARTTFKILYISSNGLFENRVRLFQAMAASLSTNIAPISQLEYQVLKTAEGLSVRFRDIELIVEHCVEAEEKATSPASYVLKLHGEERSKRTITTRTNEPRDLPDVAVFGASGYLGHPYWFTTVKKAMMAHQIPIVTVAEPRSSITPWSASDRAALIEGSDLHFDDIDELAGKKIRRSMQTLLHSRQPAEKPPVSASTKPASTGVTDSVAKSDPPSGAVFSGNSSWNAIATSLAVLLVITSGLLQYFVIGSPVDPASHLAVRREALSSALTLATNSTGAATPVNIEHLLPVQRQMNGSYDGFTSDVRSHGIDPNHIIVSLPNRKAGWSYPRPFNTTVHKASREPIESNLTMLIDGVYDITVDPEDAFGFVWVLMSVKNAPWHVTISHDFGRRSITTDLTKTINKDIAKARNDIQGLKSKFGREMQQLGLEISAGAAATRNVTSELAVYVTKDVQVLANTALSVFNTAFRSTTGRISRFRSAVPRETHNALFRARTKANKLRNGIKTSACTTKKSITTVRSSIKGAIRKSLRDTLISSRAKALALKSHFSGARKEVANSTSASKELSLRLQNLWSPTEKTKRAGSLPDIARCVGKKDYAACRREQREKVTKELVVKPDMGDVVAKAVQNPPKPSKSARDESYAALIAEQEASLKMTRKEREQWRKAKEEKHQKKLDAAEKKEKADKAAAKKTAKRDAKSKKTVTVTETRTRQVTSTVG